MVARPGVFGALQDAIEAAGRLTAPRSVTQTKARIDEAVDNVSEGRRYNQHNRDNEG